MTLDRYRVFPDGADREAVTDKGAKHVYVTTDNRREKDRKKKQTKVTELVSRVQKHIRRVLQRTQSRCGLGRMVLVYY